MHDLNGRSITDAQGLTRPCGGLLEAAGIPTSTNSPRTGTGAPPGVCRITRSPHWSSGSFKTSMYSTAGR